MSTSESSPTQAKRPYLRSEDRRRQLLEVAATIAGRDGLDSLSVVGLASEAGVSRQLVYDHFSDLPGLVIALLVDRFASVVAAISVPSENDADAVATTVTAARIFLELPPADLYILRTLLSHANAPEHKLSDLARLLRARTTDRWTVVFGSANDEVSRANAWALFNALYGLSDAVSMQAITIDQALAQLRAMLVAVVDAAPASTPPA